MSSMESAATAVLAYGPGIVVKATAILALSAGIALAAKRASAARRHLLWLCALGSCGALVLLAPLPRHIVLPLPAFIPTQSPAAFPIRPTDTLRATARLQPHAPSLEASAFAKTSVDRRIPRIALVSLMVWLGGFLFVLLRFASAYRAISAVVRRSRLVASPAWRASLAQLTNRTDIALRVSADIPSPFTIGLVHPIIVLSADAHEWSDDRKDAILSHEIAHVERGDVAAQSIGLFACSLLWFHPLAWFALAQLRREAESAADDRVIDTGASPISYAVHLVEIARGLGDSTSRLPVAVGMGTPPLEKRVRAMLDRTRSRQGVSARARILGLTAALSAMVPVGGLEFARAFRPGIRPVVHRVEARSSAQPVTVPTQAPVRPVETTDVRNTLITAHDSVAPSLPDDAVLPASRRWSNHRASARIRIFQASGERPVIPLRSWPRRSCRSTRRRTRSRRPSTATYSTSSAGIKAFSTQHCDSRTARRRKPN